MANSDFLEVIDVGFSPKPIDTIILFGQLEFKSEDYKKDEETGLLVLVNEDKVKKYIEKVLEKATEEKANLIVFPELSVPEKYLDLIQEWCNKDKDAKRVVVAGSHYYKKSAKEYISRCPVIFFEKVEYTEKINPSPYEKSDSLSKGCSNGTQARVFCNTSVGNLAVLICMDYMVDGVRASVLKKDIDILCIVSMQNESKRYFKQMDLDCRSVEKGIYIVYANTKINNEGDGKSAFFGINPNLTGSNSKNQQDFEHRAFELETNEYAIVEVNLSNKRVSVPYNHTTKPNFRYDLKKNFTNKSIQPKAMPNANTSVSQYVVEASEEDKQLRNAFKESTIELENQDQVNIYVNEIAKQIIKKRVIFFLGNDSLTSNNLARGSNQNLPSDSDLIKYLNNIFKKDLLECFGEEPFTTYNLAHLSQHISVAKNKEILHSSLFELFKAPFNIDIYEILAEMIKNINEDTIKPAMSLGLDRIVVITSSPDESLQKTFEKHKVPFHLLYFVPKDDKNNNRSTIIHQDEKGNKTNLSENVTTYRGLISDEHPIIFKIYGDIDIIREENYGFVITENDYINLAREDFLGILPSPLESIFKQNKVLFVKYNINNWNLRIILSHIWKSYKAPHRSWIIQENIKKGDKKLWESLNVDLIPTTDVLLFISSLKKQVNSLL